MLGAAADLLGRAVDAVSSLGGGAKGGEDREAFDDLSIDAAPPMEEERDEGLTWLTGRVVFDRDGRIVVEIEVGPGGFAWDRPSVVTLEWADGTVIEVTVEAARTTRPGHVASGQAIRLSVLIDGERPPGRPTTADLDLAAGSVRVELS